MSKIIDDQISNIFMQLVDHFDTVNQKLAGLFSKN